MTTFYSKVDNYILYTIYSVFSIVLFKIFLTDGFGIEILVVSLFLILGGFLIHQLFHGFKYIIDPDSKNLIVYVLEYRFKTVDITKIEAISHSYNIWSAPAASFDKLKIKTTSPFPVYISPEKKLLFIEELLKINPSIEVDYRGMKE